MPGFYLTKVVLNADVSRARHLKNNFARLICDYVMGFVPNLLLAFVLL